MKKCTNSKKVAAVAAISGLLLGGFVGAVAFPTTDYQVVEKVVTETEYVEVPVEVVKEVQVEKIVNVENTDSYDKLEQLLQDREIFDDAYSVLEQLEAEDEAIKLAIEEIKSELAEELEDADMVDDEDDVDDIEIEEDFDEIKILKSDFEDEEYKFVFSVEFEDEEKDEKFDVLVTVEVEEGVAKIKKVEWD